MMDMVKGNVIPACVDYQNDLAALLERKKACGKYDVSLEEHLLGRISTLSASLLKHLLALEDAILKTKKDREILVLARFYRDKILRAMSELRIVVDELETFVAKKHWHLPTYAEMLYSVN
jgi:glutamine synthetase